jgi:hypothetical protein
MMRAGYTSDLSQVHRFVSGLLPHLHDRVIRKKPATLKQAVDLAVEQEEFETVLKPTTKKAVNVISSPELEQVGQLGQQVDKISQELQRIQRGLETINSKREGAANNWNSQPQQRERVDGEQDIIRLLSSWHLTMDPIELWTCLLK